MAYVMNAFNPIRAAANTIGIQYSYMIAASCPALGAIQNHDAWKRTPANDNTWANCALQIERCSPPREAHADRPVLTSRRVPQARVSCAGVWIFRALSSTV